MSDGQSPAGPATHRKRNGGRDPVDSVVLSRLEAAVAAPLAFVFVVLGVAFVACGVFELPSVVMLVAMSCTIAGSVLIGFFRARSAARAVSKAGRDSLLQVVEAASAVERSVVWTAEELCRGGRPSIPERASGEGEVAPVEAALAVLDEVRFQAVASLVRVHDDSQSALLVEMLHQLSRREHALIERSLALLDQLQALTEDPDLLDVLYKLDHQVTRMRRWVESKAVLGGESLRSAREPVSVMEVLRGAVQEVLHYARVTVAAGPVGVELGLPRHVGPDLTHLLAELVDNATQFSDPASRVWVRARPVAAGLLIEVEDEVAIAMDEGLRERLNILLRDPDRIDVSTQVRAGRIGLLTAAKIGSRHGVSVRLLATPAGTAAQVVVPSRLLVTMIDPSGISASLSSQAGNAAPVPGAEVPSLRFAGPSAPARPAPHGVGQLAPSRAGATGSSPLPQRVPEQFEPPASSHPTRPVSGPRFGAAGAFQDGINAARLQRRPDPARLDVSASSPSSHP
ncbi:ATP-binding protein [Streptomyces griseoviridis]|uniref:ATP-binding protein n=1 Tax=Streptomyces griseoviridis TaxID=45398 RepID=UPI0019CF9A38|nr:ATP-binding protein [Streptomyces griseoviridis]